MGQIWNCFSSMSSNSPRSENKEVPDLSRSLPIWPFFSLILASLTRELITQACQTGHNVNSVIKTWEKSGYFKDKLVNTFWIFQTKHTNTTNSVLKVYFGDNFWTYFVPISHPCCLFTFIQKKRSKVYIEKGNLNSLTL